MKLNKLHYTYGHGVFNWNIMATDVSPSHVLLMKPITKCVIRLESNILIKSFILRFEKSFKFNREIPLHIFLAVKKQKDQNAF